MKTDGKISIYFENIAEFSRRSHISKLQREGQLSELIDAFIECSEDDDCHSLYKDFSDFLPAASHIDKAMLCAHLSQSQKYGIELYRQSLYEQNDIPAGAHGRVAVVRNKYNEKAYERFMSIITSPKIIYSPSFSEACDDVFDGRCEFCILPIENSQNGRLFSFYSMLDRYELRICATCRLEGETHSERVRYALVGKASPDRIPKNLEWCFEFSIISDSGSIIGDIADICGAFDARLSGIDSLSVSYDDDLQKYYFTFKLPQRTISGFELYLSEEYSRYTPIGLYPIIN